VHTPGYINKEDKSICETTTNKLPLNTGVYLPN